METTSIRLAIRDLPDQFDASRIPVVLEVHERVLTEEIGTAIEPFADSMTITIPVPTSKLLAAAQALRDMRLI